MTSNIAPSTATIRAAVRALDPEARVVARGGRWTIETSRPAALVRRILPELGLVEAWPVEVEGSRWDWVHVLTVEIAP